MKKLISQLEKVLLVAGVIAVCLPVANARLSAELPLSAENSLPTEFDQKLLVRIYRGIDRFSQLTELRADVFSSKDALATATLNQLIFNGLVDEREKDAALLIVHLYVESPIHLRNYQVASILNSELVSNSLNLPPPQPTVPKRDDNIVAQDHVIK